jgi:hypothetical protein
MDKLKEFISKPKHLYFGVILMFVLVVGLASVSFSYVEESSNNTKQTEVIEIDTRMSSEVLKDGKITLAGNEARTFKIDVMSNNSFDSYYSLYYKCDGGDVVVTADELRNEIGSYDVHQIEVTVSNFNSYPVEVTLGLNTGYSEDGITTIGKKVVQE